MSQIKNWRTVSSSIEEDKKVRAMMALTKEPENCSYEESDTESESMSDWKDENELE